MGWENLTRNALIESVRRTRKRPDTNSKGLHDGRPLLVRRKDDFVKGNRPELSTSLLQ
jgi:hypothetical protein